MFDVDVNCNKCGAHVSQLPFQPSGDRPIYCSECNREHKQNKRNGGGGQRQMYQVDLKCAGCGAAITQLPFMPKGDNPIYCRECYRNNKQS